MLTIPAAWQRRFNESQIEVVPRMDNPVPRADRRRALPRFPTSAARTTPTAMRPEEFDSYGATVRTLRGFIASYQDLVATIRDLMLPNPDVG